MIIQVLTGNQTMTSSDIVLPKFHSGQVHIVKNRAKRTVLRCGRRFGKTILFESLAQTWSLESKFVGYFAPDYKIMIPTYERCKNILSRFTKRFSKTDGIIELKTGGLIEFWTLNNPDAGRSRHYDEVLIDEASLVGKGLRELWEQSIEPTLLDTDGNVMMAGTPKGIDEENFFHSVCTDKSLGFKEFHAPTSANPNLNQAAVARLKYTKPPLVYQQEHLADFVDWSGAAFFSLDSLLDHGLPVIPTMNCDSVFAIVDTAIKDGKEHDGTAVTYFAVSKFHGHRLVILDWDIVQIKGDLLENWMPNVYRRCEELAVQYKARHGSLGAFIEDKQTGTILIQQAARRGLPGRAIDSKLTAAGKDARAISVSGYVFQGMVKICHHAFDKVVNFKGVTRNHFISQVCGFRIGAKDPADDLNDCFTYGISIALGDSSGY